MAIETKITTILNYLSTQFPNPQTELQYETPFQLFVAVVLSAQCTDVRVNKITPALFKALPDSNAMTHSDIDTIYGFIKNCSYPNNKAIHLYKSSQIICNTHNGAIPDTFEALIQLPGVGKKTAHVLLSVLYHKPYLAVDTHIHRVANRLGLVKTNSPDKTEQFLAPLLPQEILPEAHHYFLLHGRYVCKARKPLCHSCGLNTMCEFIYSSSLLA